MVAVTARAPLAQPDAAIGQRVELAQRVVVDLGRVEPMHRPVLDPTEGVRGIDVLAVVIHAREVGDIMRQVAGVMPAGVPHVGRVDAARQGSNRSWNRSFSLPQEYGHKKPQW